MVDHTNAKIFLCPNTSVQFERAYSMYKGAIFVTDRFQSKQVENKNEERPGEDAF